MNEAEQERISDVAGWEKPPRERRNRYDWEAIAARLRARPGEWAKIFDDDRLSVVNALRQGSVKSLTPDMGFEIRTRNNVRYPVRKCTLYMRYVPPKEG